MSEHCDTCKAMGFVGRTFPLPDGAIEVHITVAGKFYLKVTNANGTTFCPGSRNFTSEAEADAMACELAELSNLS